MDPAQRAGTELLVHMFQDAIIINDLALGILQMIGLQFEDSLHCGQRERIPFNAGGGMGRNQIDAFFPFTIYQI